MKLVIGCGYLGSHVARLWRAQEQAVAVVTRSAERAGDLQTAGFAPIVADVTNPSLLDNLRQIGPIGSVLYAVGFDRSSDKSMREVYVEGLRNTLDALPATVTRFIYISTTGVYAQNDGSWIDEDSSCEPRRDGGRISLEAETLLTQHAICSRAIVLRLAGIYGPGRIPRREELLSGQAVTASPDAWLNLIHVDDAARIVLAVEGQVKPPRVYLVSDGCPVRRRDYYAEAARLLQAPPPVFARAEDRGSSAVRGNTDKRVNNARLINEIRYQLQYPTYKQGLAASVDTANAH